MNLQIFFRELSICKLDPSVPIPGWALNSEFFSAVKTSAELSIVCSSANIPEGILREDGWRALGVIGALDFSAVGVLASIANPLAASGISIFVISTFSTDYILIKQVHLHGSCVALEEAGVHIAWDKTHAL